MILVARMVSLAAVVLAPLLAEAITHALSEAGSSVVGAHAGRSRRRLPRWERATLLVTAVGYLAVLAVAAPRLAAEPADDPTELAPRLAALPSQSTVLVEDGVGGWMEWAVPSVHPVIDGMLDAYPVEYIHRFLDATKLKPGWQRFVSRSGARVGVLEAGSPLSAALQDQLGWRPVAHDGRWVFLRAPSR
jgi:hypothetical protein